MSARLQHLVLASRLSPSGVRLVALIVAFHAGELTGEMWASLATIANEAGFSRDRVKQIMRVLLANGVLEVVPQDPAKGRRRTTTYVFSPGWIGRHASPVSPLPGESGQAVGGSPARDIGKPAHPNIDERKTSSKSSLSSIGLGPSRLRDCPGPEGSAQPGDVVAECNAPAEDKDKQPLASEFVLAVSGSRPNVLDVLALSETLGIESRAESKARGVATFEQYAGMVLVAAESAGLVRRRAEEKTGAPSVPRPTNRAGGPGKTK